MVSGTLAVTPGKVLTIGAGGGPGSSSAPGLTDATVTTASVDTDGVQPELGSVTIAPVS